MSINISEELKKRIQSDDPAALYEYSELLRATDPAESDKYAVFAAQLGFGPAYEHVGDRYLESGDTESAEQYYKAGAKAGILDCSVKLAALKIDDNEHEAVRELEELAQSGVRSACSALSEYYRSIGNRKQSAYWRSMLK